jgi:hypothetical protein
LLNMAGASDSSNRRKIRSSVMRVWVPMAFMGKPPFFDLDYTLKKEKSQDRWTVLARFIFCAKG